MNSSAITMSAQCQPIAKNERPTSDKSETKNRNRVNHHQSAWTYISSRIVGAIHNTFKKGNPNLIVIRVSWKCQCHKDPERNAFLNSTVH